MANLYITDPGARLEVEAGRLIVSSGEDVVISVPAHQVDEVVIVGRAGVTTPALGLLLDRGIGLLLLTQTGTYRGRLVAERSRNVALRQEQYRRADDSAFCLAISRAYVEGKIRNARTLLMRLDADGNRTTHRMVDVLKEMIDQLPSAVDKEALLGYEGQASRAYFRGIRPQIHSPWTFTRRARRPPPDPVNALLSIAYTLLHESCYSALEASGLDPTIGFLHAPAYGRASLAADLMEEFRPVIADSVVLTVLNKRMVHPHNFSPDPGGKGIRLDRDAWSVVANQYMHRLQTTVRLPGMTRSLSYQKVLEVQARSIRRVIEGRQEAYEPFLTK